MAIYALISAGIVLDFVCWRWLKVSASLFYLECFQILLETCLVPFAVLSSVPVVALRFIGATVLLGVDARPSIATATLAALVTKIATHIILSKEKGADAQFVFGCLIIVFGVFAISTVFWVYLRLLINLKL